MIFDADEVVFSSDALVSNPAWCWIHWDATGHATHIGPGADAFKGFSAQQCLKNPRLLDELILEADRKSYQDHLARARTEPGGSALNFRLATPPGMLSLREFRRPVFSDNGQITGFEGLWLDTTGQQIIENRLEQQAWKDTLGVLIPGLIHEFNNNLTGILALSELFLGQIEASHPFQEGLNLIKQSAQQACQRLQRLHSLYRGDAGSRCYLDLNELARDTVNLLNRALRKRTDLDLTTSGETLPVYADPVALQQTIIQLALNAIEAMPDGGRIYFRTRKWERLLTGVPSLRLPIVSLSVEDGGPGLNPGEARAVFDPLYTTKPGRADAGLGLHYARRFAESHQGNLSIQSRSGAGSKFTLWLPQADFSEAEPAREEPPRA